MPNEGRKERKKVEASELVLAQNGGNVIELT